MSARTERLLEEIAALETKIASEPQGSSNVTALQEQLVTRRRELITASEALNEGARVLKG
jgi:hypothetical protein